MAEEKADHIQVQDDPDILVTGDTELEAVGDIQVVHFEAVGDIRAEEDIQVEDAEDIQFEEDIHVGDGLLQVV